MTQAGRIAIGCDREQELHALETAADAGRSVLVSGPLGIGKTHLLHDLVGHRADERCILHAAGSESATTTPFGAIADWLPDVDSPRQAGYLRAAIDHLTELTAGRRPLLVIDDIHQLDRASVALLHELAVTGGMPLIAAARSDHVLPPMVADLCAGLSCDFVALGPLPDMALRQLAVTHLTTPVDDRIVDELVARAGGNPLFAIELARAHDAGRPGEITDHLVDLVQARLGTLSAPARALLDQLAIVEPLPKGVVDSADDLSHAALVELERATLVTVATPDLSDRGDTGVIVRFAHPIYGEAIRASFTPHARQTAAASLRDWVGTSPTTRYGDAVHVAGSLLRLDEPVGADLATIAAREALTYLDTDLARRLVDVALQSDPDRPDSLLAAGLVQQAAGDVDTADRLLQQSFDNATGHHELRDAARALARHRLRHLDDPPAAAKVVEDAARRCSDPSVREWFRLEASLIASTRDRYVEVIDRSRSLLSTDGLDTHLEARLLLDVLFGQTQTGNLAQFDEHLASAEALVTELRATEPSYLDLLRDCRIRAFTERGQLHEVAARATGWLEKPRHSPTPTALTSGGLATARWMMGDVAAARRGIEVALDELQKLDPWHALPTFTYYAALLAAIDGETTVAEEMLLRAGERAGSRYAKHRTWESRATGWVQARRDVPQAVELFAEATRIAIDEAQYAWALWVVHDALLFDGSSAVAGMLTELEGVFVDAPLLDAMVDHGRARVAGDLIGVRRSAESFERAHAGWYAADAWRAAAQLAPDATARARAATRAVMAGPRAALGPHAPEMVRMALSQRRIDIAGRAAQGVTSAAIAAELGISRRTVEDSLRHTYRTLGIGGRDELSSVLPTEGKE